MNFRFSIAFFIGGAILLTSVSRAAAAGYAYDNANRLTRVTGTSQPITYAYDAFGNVVQRCEGNDCVELILDQSSNHARIVAEVGSAGPLVYAYGPDGATAVQTPDKKVHRSAVDALGSVRALVSTDGKLESRSAYDAYGRVRAQSSTVLNHLGFAGEYTGSTDGIVWLRARSYSPESGRFLQRDTFGGFLAAPQSLNRFSYAWNAPTRWTDPSGHFIGLDDAIAIGIGTAAVTAALGALAPPPAIAPEKVNAFDPCAGNRSYASNPFEQAFKFGVEGALTAMAAAQLAGAALGGSGTFEPGKVPGFPSEGEPGLSPGAVEPPTPGMGGVPRGDGSELDCVACSIAEAATRMTGEEYLSEDIQGLMPGITPGPTGVGGYDAATALSQVGLPGASIRVNDASSLAKVLDSLEPGSHVVVGGLHPTGTGHAIYIQTPLTPGGPGTIIDAQLGIEGLGALQNMDPSRPFLVIPLTPQRFPGGAVPRMDFRARTVR